MWIALAFLVGLFAGLFTAFTLVFIYNFKRAFYDYDGRTDISGIDSAVVETIPRHFETARGSELRG